MVWNFQRSQRGKIFLDVGRIYFILYCKIPDIFRWLRNMVGSILLVLTFSKSADDYFGNIWEFFGNSLEILWEFFRNSLGLLGILKLWRIWQILTKYSKIRLIGILREFFGNSLRIVLEFFGNVCLGGSECVGVDFGQFDLIWDLMTHTKTICRSASWRILALKKPNEILNDKS